MKQFRFPRAALSLLAPILIFSAVCVGTSAVAKNNSGVPKSTAASLQVVFISNLSGLPSPVANFFLNVTGVRINPFPNSSHTGTPKETAGNWSLIPVPTPAAPAQNPGALPIDIVAGQSQMQAFNSIGIGAKKFNTVEVALDTGNPGYIIPLCNGSAGPEGCIKYPIQVTGGTLSFQSPVETQLHATTLLPISLNAQVQSVPTAVGQPYQIMLSASPVPSPVIFDYIGTFQGQIKGAKGNAIAKKSHLRVFAELTGTNTVVSSSDVLNGDYKLFLPAAAGVGTFYDLFIFGGSTSIETMQAQQALPNATASIGFTVKGGQTTGSFAGTITDACTGNPIEGATVQVLQAPSAAVTPDCATSPALCVSVASGLTGATGAYPLPGTLSAAAPLGLVPIGSPTATYVLEISAPGYDTLFMNGSASGVKEKANAVDAGRCFTPTASVSPTPAVGTCNFSLTTSYVQGNVSLTAPEPSGNKTFINVLAENHDSNTLVSSLPNPVIIFSGNTSAPFTLNVPSHPANESYDLFAVAEDSYQGGPDPYPGHHIVVRSGFTPTAACATAAATATPIFGDMDCTGHGSITGSVTNSDGGTSVQLLKDGVAITQASVALASPTPTAAADYSFCVPPDAAYKVQRLENLSGSPTATGTPAAVGVMPPPTSTSSPACPTTCSNTNTTCPGNCNPTAAPTL